ncbi:aldo/keto reductase [Sphaerimonospora mesophila]|uniref:aldo/keto reductase n=1 Tax=Sphaerimonospora mesophila TaxID=37483 RepID=UPI000A92859D
MAGGVLTGKYSRDDLTAANVASGDGTRKSFNSNLGLLTERNLAIADVVREVAAEMGRTPAQVGLAWTVRNPSVTASIIGARTPRSWRTIWAPWRSTSPPRNRPGSTRPARSNSASRTTDSPVITSAR